MESLFESFIQALMSQVRGPVLCHGHLLRQNITTARKIPRRCFYNGYSVAILCHILVCVPSSLHLYMPKNIYLPF